MGLAEVLPRDVGALPCTASNTAPVCDVGPGRHAEPAHEARAQVGAMSP